MTVIKAAFSINSFCRMMCSVGRAVALQNEFLATKS